MAQLNLFQIISFVLAASAIIKVFFGIFFHQKLYAWASKNYEQSRRPPAVNLLLIYAMALLIFVWIATILDYVRYGWILTAFITLASIKSLGILINWNKTSSKFSSFINRAGKRLWLVDLFVGALGLIFLSLGFWLY